MSESPPPSADAIQKWLTTAENLIALIVDNLRRGTWVKRLLLVDALIVFGFNPGVAGQVFKMFFGLEQLPDWYTKYFWMTVGLLFTIALGVALRTPIRSQTDIAEFRERKAIKGLRPFTAADTEIFAKLQRNRSLKECLEAITQDSFRFGILLGESGCGKTSFLRAGLVPTLSDPAAAHRGVYIQFNDRAPVDIIREALAKDLKLENGIEGDEGAEFLGLLTRAQETAGKPLILVFDQFEQFFVHYKTKDDRQRFVRALTEWYRSALPVKILISIRGDMSDRLVELQHAIRYSLAPQEVFRLEKFAPLEAAAVLRVIAETEELKFDERFVQELTERELARDGLISPVDLQILSWMIERQNTAELKAFDRVAFQKFGGMEGLLTRFLEKTLEARVIKSQREAAVKVLLALTDLERNLRAGVLTVAELQAKSPGTQPDEIAEAAVWLGRNDVRLITPVERDTETAYELAHERLIPAVRQVAGKELTQAQKANQLLDRRVNEWIGNHRNSRYLFSWRELWLLEREKPYLVWGDNRSNKERLIAGSKQRMYRGVGAMAALLLIPLTGWRWLESAPGQRWQIRRELAEVSQNVEDQAEATAAIAFAKDGNEQQALKIFDQIQDSYNKSRALSAIAAAYGTLNQPDQAMPLLEQALKAANSIQDSYAKPYALRAIAEAVGTLNQPDRAMPLLEQALKTANSIQDSYAKSYALSAIAEAYGALNQPDRAVPLLEQALKIANSIKESHNKSSALRAIAAAIGMLNQPDQAMPLLEQALKIANSMEDSDYKSSALIPIAAAYGALNQPDQAMPLLEQALKIANSIQDSYYRSDALRAIAAAYGALNQPDQAIPLLEQALQAANSMEDSDYKSSALSAIAAAYGTLNQPNQAILLLEQALKTANSIEDSDDKSRALRAIAAAQAKIGNWKQARQTVDQCDSNPCRANALSAVLTVWAEQQHPELKQEEE